MNVKLHKCAHRYAKAWINAHSQELSKIDIDQFSHTIDLLKTASKKLAVLDLHPLAKEQQIRASEIIMKHFSLPGILNGLVRLLVCHRKAQLIARVFLQIKKILTHQTKIASFAVSTSHALQKSDQEHIIEFIKKSLNLKTISAAFMLDDSLICGIKITNEEVVFEQSIAKQLRDIETTLRL